MADTTSHLAAPQTPPPIGVAVEVTPVAEKAPDSKDAARAKASKKAHTQESLLGTRISAEAGQKIESLTGIKANDALGDVGQFFNALQILKGIFSSKGDESKGADLFTLLGISDEEIDAISNNASDRVEPEPPPEPVDVTDAPESKAPVAKWQPSTIELSRKESWKARSLAVKAKERIEEKNYLPHFEEASKKYNIPVSTLASIVMKESNMNTGIDNGEGSGAMGLAQVMPKTLKGYREKVDAKANPYDPLTGIMITAWHARNAINAVDRAVTSGTFTTVVRHQDGSKKKVTYQMKAEYAIDPADVFNLYLTHNSGIAGYIAYRNYKSAEASGDQLALNKAESELWGFQQKEKRGKPDWQNREFYARTVAEVAYHWNDINQPKT